MGVQEALFLLGCWAGPVEVEHKYIDTQTCPRFAVEFALDGAEFQLIKHELLCEDGFDLTWQSFEWRKDSEGNLWKAGNQVRDEAIVGWVKSDDFHVAEGLNPYMTTFIDVLPELDTRSREQVGIDWKSEFVRNDELFWGLEGKLKKVECFSP